MKRSHIATAIFTLFSVLYFALIAAAATAEIGPVQVHLSDSTLVYAPLITLVMSAIANFVKKDGWGKWVHWLALNFRIR